MLAFAAAVVADMIDRLVVAAVVGSSLKAFRLAVVPARMVVSPAAVFVVVVAAVVLTVGLSADIWGP